MREHRVEDMPYRTEGMPYRVEDMPYRTEDMSYRVEDILVPHLPAPGLDDQPWATSSPYPTLPDVPLGPDPSTDGPHPEWDPAEELAFLLQEAIDTDRDTTTGRPPPDSSDWPLEREGMTNLATMSAGLPPVNPPGHGRRRAKAPTVTWAGVGSFLLTVLSVTLVTMVSVFSGIIAYDPLRHIAETHSPAGTVNWWPLLVYGPWAVASLSVLRAALHQRRAAHSWSVVLLFSLMCMLLCVAEAPRNHTGMAAAALPTVASLACFHQLVRFITLTRPPRKANPRHRNLARSPSRLSP
ncbi:DUF2637 domain-containing protein [Streptomyces ficellus]|uniref:DUF2637 domain-containing protein n=1 Tax=Streptomyces ficellus TaxID=1977088 RepID=A0A6I6FLA1_9ACTN|nr:DUF2637 domain-containing protein [Streptomyces ficellus]QGV80075.1 DUF2637 domain-containing protein [Streptomyces ficellus]